MKPKPIARRTILLHLALAMIALAVAVWAFGVLKEWRLPVELSLSTSTLRSTKGIRMLGLPGDPIHWHTKVNASNLTIVANPPSGGEVETVLPISPAKCVAVATRLGAECNDSRIRSTGIGLRGNWGLPLTEVSVATGRISAVSLETQIETFAGRTFIRIFAHLNRPTTLHFASSPLPDIPPMPNGHRAHPDNTRPTITLASRSSDRSPFNPFVEPPRSRLVELPLPKHGEWEVEVRPVSFDPMDLRIEASGRHITSFDFIALAPLLEIQNFSGVLTTSTGGRQTFDPAATLLLTGEASIGPQLSMCMPGGCSPRGELLKLDSGLVTSVLADGEELVPPVWDRYSAVVVALWTGLFGILVLGEFATVLRGVWSRSAPRPPKKPREQPEARIADGPKQSTNDAGS